MIKRPQSTDEKPQELAETKDGLEIKAAAPTTSILPKTKPKVVDGPKTKLAVQIMAGVFGLFWILWLAIALLVSPPQQVSDLLVIPFSALVLWLIFMGHRWILIAAVRKASGRRGD